VERKQLEWRAAGVVVSLALFPFAVAEVLPVWVSYADPFVFVVTLVVPVLRHDLWAIDTLIRRSAAYAVTAPGSVVEHLMRAVAEMLHLPYLAVQRESGVLAAYGDPTDRVEQWPLEYHGERVGTLVAAPRRGLASIDEQDRQVLATLAQLVSGSVRAEALTADLRSARQRLVSAREEERRRLRRDLHDGLGPMLTGLGLNLDAAQSALALDPDRAATYLGNAKEASTLVITGLRELVYGLRPPALDDLGFAGALRLHTERIARDAGLTLDLRMPEGLSLPAAVEVAAFRTVVEAVTNVVRHSGADKVVVTVEPDPDRLVLTVTDHGGPAARQGPGHGARWRAGVGLSAMRERAEELGGTFEAGPTLEGGRVCATYPMVGGHA
jgi:signal transduction histidine kinase